MSETTVSQITPIVNGNGLQFVEYQGKILFSSEEIGRQLGYSKPSKSVNILFNRNQKELSSYAVGIKVMSTDGKYYEVRHFTEEGVYIISMLANTPRAAEFRARLAALLREIREHQLELAREAGYQQGLENGVTPLALEMAEKESWIKGFKEGERQTRRKDGLARLEKALPYLQKGLNRTETARLVGCPPSTLRDTLRRFERLSEQAAAPAQPALQQGVLL